MKQVMIIFFWIIFGATSLAQSRIIIQDGMNSSSVLILDPLSTFQPQQVVMERMPLGTTRITVTHGINPPPPVLNPLTNPTLMIPQIDLTSPVIRPLPTMPQ